MAARPSDQPPLFDILKRRDRPEWVWYSVMLCLGVGASSLWLDGGLLAIKFFEHSTPKIALPPIFTFAHLFILLAGVILGLYLILIGIETLCGVPVGGRPHRVYARIRIVIALTEGILIALMYHQANSPQAHTLIFLLATMALLQWFSEALIYTLIR